MPIKRIHTFIEKMAFKHTQPNTHITRGYKHTTKSFPQGIFDTSAKHQIEFFFVLGGEK